MGIQAAAIVAPPAMNASLLERQLALWTLRAAICALPSGFFAMVSGYNSPREVAALVAGVATVILVYAVATARLGLHAPHARGSFSHALAIAANIRTLLALVSIAGIALPPLGVLMFVDVWCGLVSIWFVSFLTGQTRPELADSFVFTYVTTLVQAALVSLGLALLTLLVWSGVQATARIRVALAQRRANVGSDGTV